MNPVFHVAGKLLTFGLLWKHFSGPKADKQAKRAAREDSLPYMARVAHENSVQYGYLREYDREAAGRKPKKGQFLSAAALFATHPEVPANAVLLYPYTDLGTDAVAVVVVHAGEIFSDAIGIPNSAIAKHLTDVVDQIHGFGQEDEATDFTVYSTDPNLHHDAKAIELADLLHDKAALAAIVDARSQVGLSLACIAIIVLLGGPMAWSEWKDYQQRNQPAQQPVQQGPTPAELYEQALNARLRQIGVTPATFIAAMRSPIGDRQTPFEGYDLKSTGCNEAGVCTELWDQMQGVGFIDRFVAANEGMSVRNSEDGKTATVSFSLQLPRVSTTRAALPRSAAAQFAMQALLQRYAILGIRSKIEPARPFALPVSVQETVLPKGVLVREIPIEFSGPSGAVPHLFGAEVEPELRLPPNLYVTELKLDGLNGPALSTTFTLKANLYVQQ